MNKHVIFCVIDFESITFFISSSTFQMASGNFAKLARGLGFKILVEILLESKPWLTSRTPHYTTGSQRKSKRVHMRDSGNWTDLESSGKTKVCHSTRTFWIEDWRLFFLPMPYIYIYMVPPQVESVKNNHLGKGTNNFLITKNTVNYM